MDEAGFTNSRIASARKKLKTTELITDIVDAIPDGKEKIFLHSVIKNHYPRIDHKVTIDMRRLIRMPGSVHTRTGNVSEYMNPITFNPMTDATNISTLLGE